eukprot:CAMPEP_0179300570 /NCGR_PEP_ID=MMETSP0797-20121207/47103_1 /TAXON_ID=47934 /ORGANISM="Dinophysis acuminata, Strain DAEP01" /LENGTH=208 /DNA_ID=CAMNT_0021010045 /DNA_START=96 /DNA_END=719 /DNA_ORIENTATION=+
MKSVFSRSEHTSIWVPREVSARPDGVQMQPCVVVVVVGRVVCVVAVLVVTVDTVDVDVGFGYLVRVALVSVVDVPVTELCVVLVTRVWLCVVDVAVVDVPVVEVALVWVIRVLLVRETDVVDEVYVVAEMVVPVVDVTVWGETEVRVSVTVVSVTEVLVVVLGRAIACKKLHASSWYARSPVCLEPSQLCMPQSLDPLVRDTTDMRNI